MVWQGRSFPWLTMTLTAPDPQSMANSWRRFVWPDFLLMTCSVCLHRQPEQMECQRDETRFMS